MSEAFVPVVESLATPEIQDKAEKLGWIPPSRFKGDPERFIDADAYVERGETVLPIVKEHNKRLERELAEVRATSGTTAAALKAAQESIRQIEERHAVELQKTVERTREQVKAQLAAASEAGDHEGVAELTDQLTTLNVEAARPKTAPAPIAPASTVQIDPELQAWNSENPWFGTDKRKTALALGIAQELREGGESSTGRRFFEKVAAEVEATFSPQGPGLSKVEGARNGNGGTEEVRTGEKGFSSLPAEAKTACDADQRKFVGADKQYKTLAQWRARYAELYFS